jgi:tRNA threonylcarbamoyladenosine biosynthesis protein TsaB
MGANLKRQRVGRSKVVPQSQTRILLIETSGRRGHVGAAGGRDLIAQHELDPARTHARDLAPAIKSVLGDVGWTASDLTAVFVSVGPGSYTGLRVGVMAAKAVAYAVKCDLLAVGTFSAIAARCTTSAATLEVVGDALRGMLYAQRFTRSAESEWTPAGALRVVAKEEWLRHLGGEVLLSGPGVGLVEPELPPGARTTPVEQRDADLRGLLLAGLARYLRGERDDPWRCEPLYLRRSSAEETWDRRHANSSGPACS